MENLKKLGFGCMRLPMLDVENNKVDMEQFCKMVDTFMAKGFKYFDTAYMYHNYQSELFVKEALVKRYPRESFLLADKLPTMQLKSIEDNKRIFDEQLEKCGVDYFDYYLLHCLDVDNYAKVKEFKSMDFLRQMKAEGKIKKLGFSFHDTAEFLEKILLEIGEDIEFVQLQINYLDWDNEGIQSGKCYEVARKYNKDIIVMEPLKGGTLVNIPEDAGKILTSYNPDLSLASWGIRFAASLEGVLTVLSGVSSLEQLEDNLSYMKDFNPLTEDELKVIGDVVEIIKHSIAIPCTGCDYCLDACPEDIPISKFFALYNDVKQSIELQFLHYFYYDNLAKKNAPASSCLECGECEENCTQHIKIIDELKKVRDLLEVDLESML